MQTDKKFFDDLARIASGASGMFFEMKREIDAQVQQKMDGFLSRMNLVTREEFDVLKERFDTLQSRFESLEARLTQLETAPTSTKETTKAESAKPETTKAAESARAKPKKES
jgi:BMFP domain-containing protein YqiC